MLNILYDFAPLIMVAIFALYFGTMLLYGDKIKRDKRKNHQKK